MTTKVDYTLEEWWALQEVPLLVGVAVLYASPSGTGGMMREIIASATAVANAGQLFPENELIQALMAPDEDSKILKPLSPMTAGASKKERAEQLKNGTLAKCQRAANVLDAKATAHEIRDYKSWVMAIGGEVAAAVKEGGVFGIGAKTITEEEIELLQAIAKALRYNSYKAPAR
ncbi:MAG: hypothetical protein L0Y55_07995 [Anaerolineales bacterium]|nr:hypothetical protein [Anaerolineales bacterium]